MEKKLWRTTKWTESNISDIISKANDGNLLAAGKGAIHNQWGVYHWCFVEKKSPRNRICTKSSPVDGSPDHMKVIQADASYVVSASFILSVLEPHITNTTDEIIIHTSNERFTQQNRYNNHQSSIVSVSRSYRHHLPNLIYFATH